MSVTPPIHEAVTVALLDGAHLFLTRRNPRLAAFPGYYAFPGGKVDRDDHGAAPDHAHFAPHESRLMRALIRELREELGFDLDAACTAGTVEKVLCLGEATTPAFAPLRYRTWFYKVVLRERPIFTLDPGEAVDGEWRTVGEWNRRFESGRLLVAPPTRVAIQALDADLHVAALPPLDVEFHQLTEIPWVEPLGGLRILLVRSNTLPPAIHTNVFWLGGAGAPRVLVDPSPADRDELAKLCRRIDQFGVDLVFLTHHHPDHREYADEIARRYRVPLALSADSHARIAAKAPGYFNGVEVRHLAEGDVLTRWQGEPVRLYAVPGHDEGQLAPMPDSKTWCIVGDLIQGVGTVVIAPPEGNMRKYFASLRRVIDFDPGVIIPSHGMALGTTHYLQAALAHREQRERTIGALHQAGRGEDDILSQVYRDVDPRLVPLARLNIRSHLEKLREEGAIP